MERVYQKELNQKIKAGYPLIQIISYEWRRIYATVIRAAREISNEGKNGLIDVFLWNNVDGVKKWDPINKQFVEDTSEKVNPIEAIAWFINEEDIRAILLMEDLHLYFDTLSPQYKELQTWLKKFSRLKTEKTIIFAQPIRKLPIELEKDVFVLEIPLPDVKVIKDVIREIASELNLSDENVPKEDFDYIAEAALGLTEIEARYTFREIAISKGRLTREEVEDIVKRKEQIIKKTGILEYYNPRESFKDVGGLTKLKEWLSIRKVGFDPKAKDFGLTPPKGVLLIGIQGCGKSLIAKAIASEWKLPLLRLDVGKVFSALVGESEANLRKALALAEAVSPSILWIDEIEKALAGVRSSDVSDAGTTARVFGTLLTWMQEKEKPVFVVATANNIEILPPELLRKGRFDEIFFVDLPGFRSRLEIWRIHLEKRLKKKYTLEYSGEILTIMDKSNVQKKTQIDLKKLARISKGYSGAEIEEAINEALYRAFYEERLVEVKDFETALESTYPLSKIMGDTIQKLRQWAKARARLATDESPEELDITESKKIPKLKQEIGNPFID